MYIKPIRIKRDYEAALRAAKKLMKAKRNSAEGDALDVLVTLIEAYEAKHFPLDLPQSGRGDQVRDGAARSHSQRSRALHWPAEPGSRGAQPQTPADHRDGLEAAQRVRDPRRVPDQTARLACAEDDR